MLLQEAAGLPSFCWWTAMESKAYNYYRWRWGARYLLNYYKAISQQQRPL